MSTQTERIAALETLVAAQAESITALAQRLVEAHGRIDDASQVFNRLRAATVSALRPRIEPLPQPTAQRIPSDAFAEALEDLRADALEDHHAGASDALTPQRFFPTADILRRAARLAEISASTAAAAA